jgi:RNA polymerase sigma-70 factor, ECF subfamily
VNPVEAALADAHRHEWARVLAATARVAMDLDLAEECVQEAYAAALRSWAADGIPGNPAAWLTTTARRRAIDAIRRDSALRARLPLLVEPDGEPMPGPPDDRTEPDERWWERRDRADTADPAAAQAPDDRLRLIFTCCHPALAAEAQVALTLRLVCGVSTPDIARAFLVAEPAMAARITRAKKKIAVARIPYRVPRHAELPERLRPVLNVVHLLFTAGHTAPSGPSLVRADLVERAMDLARMLRELMPDETEVRGLYALLLVTDARRATRTDEHGRLVRLEDQDRSRWDRAVPLAMAAGPEAALAEVERLEQDGSLGGYQYLPAVKADLRARIGRDAEAAAAYRRALELTANEAERAFLTGRLAALGPREWRRAGE